MPLAPDININLKVKEYDSETATYKIDFNTNRIVSKINGVEALKQFIRKSWITKRNEFLIYDNQFGIDNDRLFGNYSEDFISTEGKRVLTEAISYDPRIILIDRFKFKIKNDEVFVNCQIESVFGTVEIEEVI